MIAVPNSDDERALIPAEEISDPARLPARPLVSVQMITYNHEAWIGEAIEGVAAQQCDFPVELLIGEDCSKDGTRAVCREYQRKYPHLIRLVISAANVGVRRNALRLRYRARGKYLAYCEGDDFWLRPEKLQRQVECMEAHPDFSFCFTRVQVMERGGEGGFWPVRTVGPGELKSAYGFQDFFERDWPTHLNTFLVRQGLYEVPRECWDAPAGWPLYLGMLLERGPAGFVDIVGSAYRRTGQGSWTSQSVLASVKRTVESFELLLAYCCPAHAPLVRRRVAWMIGRLAIGPVLGTLPVEESGSSVGAFVRARWTYAVRHPVTMLRAAWQEIRQAVRRGCRHPVSARSN